MSAAPESARHDGPRFLRILWKRRVLFLACWAGVLAAGACAAFLLPRTYSSQVSLVFERSQPTSDGARTERDPGDPRQQAEVMRRQVRSDAFLHSVLERSGIQEQPETRAWALRASRAKKYSALPAGERAAAFLTDRLRRAISIRAGDAGLILVSVGGRRPDDARRLADAVAEQFVASAKAAQLDAVRAAEELSVEQQRLYKRKLEESERRLESLRARVETGGPARQVSDVDLARYRGFVQQADQDVESARQRAADLRARFGSGLGDEDAARLGGEAVNVLLGQLKGLGRQLGAALLSTDPTGDSGAVARQVILRKTSELEIQLIRNAALNLPRRTPESRDLLVRYRLATADLAVAEARRDYLRTRVGALERDSGRAPDPEAELQRLTAEVESNRALYQSFLRELASAQITQAFRGAQLTGRFRILAPATLPLSPATPGRAMVLLAALLIGGMVGVGAVFLVERHDPSLMDAVEAESLLGLPVVGSIPRVEMLERSRRRTRAPSAEGGVPGPEPGLLHHLKPESALGLELRRIFLKLGTQERRTLLITSSTRGEGKTVTAACLAITLARQTRTRVLLVDFDLRNPTLHRALGLPTSSWGLAQILQQRSFDPRFTRPTVVPGLDFLPAGRSERPVAELLTREAVVWFMAEARSRYDTVVADAAPSLAVPDPLILGPAVEGVLYVIKAGATMRRAAELGVRVQREACDNLLGVVVNDAGDAPGYRHGAGRSVEAIGGDA